MEIKSWTSKICRTFDSIASVKHFATLDFAMHLKQLVLKQLKQDS